MVVMTGRTSAQSLADIPSTSTLETLKPKEQDDKRKIQKDDKRVNKTVIVKEGDTLREIASEQHTTWLRLFYKNKAIKHPDQIKVGQKLVIPFKNEKLKKRATTQISPKIVRDSTQVHNISADNGYDYGYCTWYVKNRRPDIPNSWGNADTWDDYAPSSGYTVGDTPKVGAIGVTRAYMHVVYVERIQGNQVFVSEMNYAGWNVISSRLAPITEFRYIY